MVSELTIEKIVQGGAGLARLKDGRICFVQGALPGEKVLAQITSQNKDFTRGKVLEVLVKSPDRVVPPCPLFGRCGGCSLQHIKADRQTFYMEQIVRDNFLRMAKLDLPSDFVIHSGNPWNYRNRARVVRCGAKGFGFREQDSNLVVPFKDCMVLTENLNHFLKEKACNIKAREINLFDNGQGKISWYYRGMNGKEFESNALNVVEIGGRKISMDASVFFQSNLGLLPKLICAVRQAAGQGEWLIDLFSGVGFFATLLQDNFKRITTVERDKFCLRHARANLKGKDAEEIALPAEDWLEKNVVEKKATLIVDPPRTGLPKTALDAIAKSSVDRLIYVSCDPVTLARDYRILAEHGFSLEHCEGFAFYPQTPHLEMLLVLCR
ncbi:MAG: class I SAM-dependent RNA methyltransferase [Fibrobacteraceae bacterium]|nr:class I SAM-dependent RNA methyltransferase [Fibrobacteraceae bacterium]